MQIPILLQLILIFSIAHRTFLTWPTKSMIWPIYFVSFITFSHLFLAIYRNPKLLKVICPLHQSLCICCHQSATLHPSSIFPSRVQSSTTMSLWNKLPGATNQHCSPSLNDSISIILYLLYLFMSGFIWRFNSLGRSSLSDLPQLSRLLQFYRLSWFLLLSNTHTNCNLITIIVYFVAHFLTLPLEHGPVQFTAHSRHSAHTGQIIKFAATKNSGTSVNTKWSTRQTVRMKGKKEETNVLSTGKEGRPRSLWFRDLSNELDLSPLLIHPSCHALPFVSRTTLPQKPHTFLSLTLSSHYSTSATPNLFVF